MKAESKSNGADGVPKIISVRTAEFLPQLVAWRARNQRAPWGAFLRDAVSSLERAEKRKGRK